MIDNRPESAADLPASWEATGQHAVRIDLGSSITTGAPLRHSTKARASQRQLPAGLGSVPAHVQEQMARIARGSADADEALEPIIGLLIDGSAQKRAAIISAFRTNAPLREQWERTFEILRS